jgi:galactarate dehydratase
MQGGAINTQTEGYRYLPRTLVGYATHANVGGVVMIGLGCETNQIPAILGSYGLKESGWLATLTIQATGGTRKSIEAAIDAMLPNVNALTRTPQPVSKLKLALEYGGSDGYSGISANPALGYAADLLVRHGGTTCLAETPEIYGAQHLLTRRAATPQVAQKLLERIEWWCNYAEPITDAGFVFMDTPGYDPIAVTGQVAGGCNVICFTTGRGSVSGFKPAPSLKLATNTQMYEWMQEDMDLDCGTIVAGHETVEQVGERIFRIVIATASGEKTLSENCNYYVH